MEHCVRFGRVLALSLSMLISVTMGATADDRRISTSGYGPARLGMSVDEAARALGVKLRNVDPAIFDDPACIYVSPEPDIAGLLIMVSNGVVVRFDVSEGGSIKTRSDLGIGDLEDKVLSTLGPAVVIEPHFYGGSKNHYLTVWSAYRESAVRFETENGRVARFYVGLDPQVTLPEGCF